MHNMGCLLTWLILCSKAIFYIMYFISYIYFLFWFYYMICQGGPLTLPYGSYLFYVELYHVLTETLKISCTLCQSTCLHVGASCNPILYMSMILSTLPFVANIYICSRQLIGVIQGHFMEAHTFPDITLMAIELTNCSTVGCVMSGEKWIVQSDWFMSLCIDAMCYPPFLGITKEMMSRGP
jgi:hypothetical protein